MFQSIHACANANTKPLLLYQTVMQSLLILIVCMAVECGLFWLSLQYEVFTGLVSWYFPAGFRVLMFLFLPLRFWPAIWLGGSVGVVSFVKIWIDPNIVFLAQFIEHSVYLLTLPVIYWCKRSLSQQPMFTVKYVFYVVLIFIITRLITTTISLFNSNRMYDIAAAEVQFDIFISHQLAALLPFLYMLNIVYFGAWVYLKNTTLFTAKNALLCIACILVGGVFIGLHALHPNIEYLFRILIFIAIIATGISFGFLGLLSITLTMTTSILVFLFGINDGDMLLNYMPFLLSYSLFCLFIGAYLNEASLANHALLKSNQTLAITNQKLQDVSNRIIAIQEQERKQISQDIHDELGQNIVVLKAELAILNKRNKVSNNSDNKMSVQHAADTIYNSVYDLMNWLRPSVLDNIGLYQTLTGDFFESRLHTAKIAYRCFVSGQLNVLSSEQEIVVFRIAQEAVTNAIKYSQADKLTMTININDNLFSMVITDNGVGCNDDLQSKSGGFGLFGIEDRVAALSGQLEIDGTDGFSLKIDFPINPS